MEYHPPFEKRVVEDYAVRGAHEDLAVDQSRQGTLRGGRSADGPRLVRQGGALVQVGGKLRPVLRSPLVLQEGFDLIMRPAKMEDEGLSLALEHKSQIQRTATFHERLDAP
jgi:hypothetical protein